MQAYSRFMISFDSELSLLFFEGGEAHSEFVNALSLLFLLLSSPFDPLKWKQTDMQQLAT